MHAAIQVAWFHRLWDVLPLVESVMGHWNSKPTVTTDRKLGGSQALDSTGICLCQRSETRQAFRDVELTKLRTWSGLSKNRLGKLDICQAAYCNFWDNVPLLFF